MKLADLTPGTLVRRTGGSAALIPDSARGASLNGRRIGEVLEIGAKVLVRWCGTDSTERIAVHRLEAAPAVAQAPPPPVFKIERQALGNGRFQLTLAFPGVFDPWATRIPRRYTPRRVRTAPPQLSLFDV